MRTLNLLLPALLLLSACGTMQETVQVRDDVYDIPDRTLVASVDEAEVPSTPESGSEDYYDAEEASNYQQGTYADQTYNDPQWYNQDRFGFGYSASPWGSSWNMSYSSGWYNSPTGMYNPYWDNSWQSGYGYYNPWNSGGYGCGSNWGGYNPYGYGYGYPGYGSCGYCGGGYGYGGYGYGGYGYNPYGYGGYGYGEYGGSSVIVRPRPSMSGGGTPGGANVAVVPRAARVQNDIGLLRPPTTQPKARTNRDASMQQQGVFRPAPPAPDRNTGLQQPDRKERKERKERLNRPERTREAERTFESPSKDQGSGGGGGNRGGGGSGGGTSPSPRPRR